MEREALKLALEALELLTDTEQTFGALDYGDNAITAIKQALAQPEQEPLGGTREAFENWAKSLPNHMDINRCGAGYSDCNTDYAWAGWQAAQPAQEPDVVMHCDSHTWTTINPPPKGSGDVNLYYAPAKEKNNG